MSQKTSNGGARHWSDRERHFLYLCFAEFGCTKAETHDLFGRVWGARLQGNNRTRYTVQQIADQYDQRFHPSKPVKIWSRICQTPGADPLLPNEPQLRDAIRDEIVSAAAQTGGGNWLVTNPRSGQTRQTSTAIVLRPAAGSLAATAIARAPAHIQAVVTGGKQIAGPAVPPVNFAPPPAMLPPPVPAAVPAPPTLNATVAPVASASVVPPATLPAATSTQRPKQDTHKHFVDMYQNTAVNESQQVLDMVHHNSLQRDGHTLSFIPGSTMVTALVADEHPVHKLGGYVLPITVNANTPREFYNPGQIKLAAMICQADVCADCNGVDRQAMQPKLNKKCEQIETGLPLVHRVHVGVRSDGTYVFHDSHASKMPEYLVTPPADYRLREVAFGIGEDAKTVVVVCKKGGCLTCDEA